MFYLCVAEVAFSSCLVCVEEGLRPVKNWCMLSLKFPRQKIVKGDFLKRYGDFRAYKWREGPFFSDFTFANFLAPDLFFKKVFSYD